MNRGAKERSCKELRGLSRYIKYRTHAATLLLEDMESFHLAVGTQEWSMLAVTCECLALLSERSVNASTCSCCIILQ